jgi:trimeric autotransporter adhesin
MALMVGAVAAQAQTPVVPAGSVVDAAAGSSPVAPGGLVEIFGTNLASAQAAADTVPLSTSLGNVSVTFNGIAAPLLFVSTGQVNAQLPWEVPASGTANMVVTTNGQPSAAVSVPVAAFSPGIFGLPAGAGFQAIAYGNSDGLIAAAAGAIPNLTTHPAKINDPTSLVILATGLGAVTPPVQTGSNVTDGGPHNTTTTPTVTVGGVAANVLFSGISPQFVGVYQLNIVIAPGTPTGNTVPLQISMGGVTTPKTYTIAVSN